MAVVQQQGASVQRGVPAGAGAAEVQALLAYWQDRSVAGGLPRRSDFGFEAMRRWLGHIGVLTVEWEPLRFKVRLCGTKIVEYLGMDSTGRYLDELVPEEWRAAALERYAAVATTGTWFADTVRFTGPDATYAKLHRLLLPCAEDGPRVDAIIAAFYRERSRGPAGQPIW
jgi:hypothetical protein